MILIDSSELVIQCATIIEEKADQNFNRGPISPSAGGSTRPKNTSHCDLLGAACTLVLAWWFRSMRDADLKGVTHTWMTRSYFGCDFYNHIDFSSRVLWHGGDPYNNPQHILFYPPLVTRLFAWVNLMTPRAALTLWQVITAGFLAVAAVAAVRCRDRLKLGQIPTILAVLLILGSTPVMFAIERGQIDPLSVVFILAALPLLWRGSPRAEFLAGAILCLAPWIKVYPALLAVGLIGLRRWRALLGFTVAGIAFLLVDLDEVRRFLIVNASHIQRTENAERVFSGSLCLWNHPLALVWGSLWTNTSRSWLALIPGKAAAGMILGLPLCWVTYSIYRCPRRADLSYPYYLCDVALATFVPPVSNDYNLCFLAIGAMLGESWDRRDPLLASVAIGLMFLWWQPIEIMIAVKPLLLFKLLGLVARWE